MVKKNTLYTINQWNAPAFMPKEKNLFYVGGKTGLAAYAAADKAANPWNYADDIDTTAQFAKTPLGEYLSSTNLFGISKADNPFSEVNMAGGLQTMANTGVGSAVLGALGSTANRATYKALSGGLHSGAGQAVADIGNTVGGVLSNIPGIGTLGGFAIQELSGAVGGVITGAVGKATDYEKLSRANEGTAAYNNFRSNAGNLDAIKGPTAQANVENAYKSGWANRGWAKKRNAALKQARVDARSFADRSIENNVDNLVDDQMNNALANYAAFGGLLEPYADSNMGAVEYDLISDSLLNKRRQAEQRNNLPNVVIGSPYAFGGDLQTNSADFPTGLTHISAGGTHEENPNEGVQYGVDEEGVPNLVEEGEVVWNDYVFSNRILVSDDVKKRFHFSKKKDLTYADAAKKLEREIQERPTDPLSKAAFNAQLQELAEAQETQKQEMEAQRAKEAFEALSPEEQAAVIEEFAQREATAQEQALQEQQAEEAALQQQQQLSPEEAAAMEQQQAAAQQMSPEEQMVMAQQMSQPAVMQACGGKINRFDTGGKVRKSIFALTKSRTFPEFVQWAKNNGVTVAGIDWDKVKNSDEIDWNSFRQSDGFLNAIKKDNPALAHSLAAGFDFGAYEPSQSSGYDLETFNKKLGEYTKSKQQGNVQGNYAIDKEFGLGNFKTIKDLEASAPYQAYTKALTDAVARAKGAKWRYKNGTSDGYDNIEFQGDNRFSKDDYDLLRTLRNTTLGTATKDKGNPVPLFTTDGEGWNSFADDATTIIDRLRNDQKGGIFHLTPGPLERAATMQNYLIDADGNVNLIEGSLNGLTRVGSNPWSDANGDYIYNYYQTPEVAAAAKAKAQDAAIKQIEDDAAAKGTPVKFQKSPLSYLRYAPVLGGAIGLVDDIFNKPDYSRAQAIIDASSSPIPTVNPHYIGDYLTYRPMDIWYEQNRLDARSNATDRAIQNTNASAGAKTAGLLASGYNSQLASGDLYRKALEYNDALQQKVTAFNRDTNKFNAQMDVNTQMANMNAALQNRRFGLNALMQGYNMMDNLDARKQASRSANLTNLLQSIGNIGEEAYDEDRLKWLERTGVLRSDRYAKDKYSSVNAKGGKLKKKKRGLTF